MTRTEFEERLPVVRQQMLGWARAKMRGDGAAAEDMVQAALLRVFQTLDKVEGGNVAPWAFGALRNVMRSDWTKRRGSREVSLVNEEGEAYDLPVEVGQEVWCEVQEALRVIAALPAERQALFVEVALFGNSLEEVAVVHGLPVGTVKSRIYRTWNGVRAAASGRSLPRAWAA